MFLKKERVFYYSFYILSVTITGETNDERKKVQAINVGARARSRWKNAIHNQILLIRMEKENKKLAGIQLFSFISTRLLHLTAYSIPSFALKNHLCNKLSIE